MTAQTFRLITLALVFLACWYLPEALRERFHNRRVWLIILLVELQFIGAAVAIADAARQGGPLVIYRTPRILASAIVALVYAYLVRRDRRKPPPPGV